MKRTRSGVGRDKMYFLDVLGRLFYIKRSIQVLNSVIFASTFGLGLFFSSFGVSGSEAREE